MEYLSNHLKYFIVGSFPQETIQQWQVWMYDVENERIQPLAVYKDQEKSQKAASELADSAAYSNNTSNIVEILAKRDADPVPFTIKEERWLQIFVQDKLSELFCDEPSGNGVDVHSSRTYEGDLLFIVRRKA